MQYLKYILLFFCTAVFSQQDTLSLRLISKTVLPANLIVNVDTFGRLYYTKNTSLIKKLEHKELRYSNVQLGEITSVSTYNSLKIVLFYKDFNSVVILDNRLAEITRIDFNTLTPFRNITQVTTGNDTTIWIFNEATQQLEVYDYKNNNTRLVTLPIEGEIISLVSNYNFCWALTKTHLYTYSYFGSLLSKIPNNGFTQISENNENLLLLKQNELVLKTKNSTAFVPIKLSNLLIKQFFVTNETLYIYDGQYLYQYRLQIK